VVRCFGRGAEFEFIDYDGFLSLNAHAHGETRVVAEAGHQNHGVTAKHADAGGNHAEDLCQWPITFGGGAGGFQ
jgi:hypothetical protein